MPRSGEKLAESKQPPGPVPEDTGLRLIGVVSGRRRRIFSDKTTGEEKAVVTYDVTCAKGIVQVDSWVVVDPIAVGEHVDLPVNARAFVSRTGPRVSFTISGQEGSRGEAF